MARMKGMRKDPAEFPLPDKDVLDAAVARVAMVQQDPFGASIKVMESDSLLKGAYVIIKALVYEVSQQTTPGEFVFTIPASTMRDPAPGMELTTKRQEDGSLTFTLTGRP